MHSDIMQSHSTHTARQVRKSVVYFEIIQCHTDTKPHRLVKNQECTSISHFEERQYHYVLSKVPNCSQMISVGKTAEEIVNVCKAQHATHMVIGTSGKRTLKKYGYRI